MQIPYKTSSVPKPEINNTNKRPIYTSTARLLDDHRLDISLKFWFSPWIQTAPSNQHIFSRFCQDTCLWQLQVLIKLVDWRLSRVGFRLRSLLTARRHKSYYKMCSEDAHRNVASLAQHLKSFQRQTDYGNTRADCTVLHPCTVGSVIGQSWH